MFKELESSLSQRSDKIRSAHSHAESAKNAARKFSKSMEEMNDANLTPTQRKAVQAARQERNRKLVERQQQRDQDFQRRKEERDARVAKYRQQMHDRRSVSPEPGRIMAPKRKPEKTMSLDSFVQGADSVALKGNPTDEGALDDETSAFTKADKGLADHSPEAAGTQPPGRRRTRGDGSLEDLLHRQNLVHSLSCYPNRDEV